MSDNHHHHHQRSGKPLATTSSRAITKHEAEWQDEEIPPHQEEKQDDFRDFLKSQKALRDRRRRSFGSGYSLGVSHARLQQTSFASLDGMDMNNKPRRGRRRTSGLDSLGDEAPPQQAPPPQSSQRRRHVPRETLDALQVLGMRQANPDEDWQSFMNATSHHNNRSSPMSRADSHLSMESVYEDSDGDEEESVDNVNGETPTNARADAEDDHHDHDNHSHHQLMLPWYCRPVQRQLWEDDQVLPHVNWHDLFFDLIFVAAAYNLGVMLISAMNGCDWPRGVVYFIGIFGPLYTIWENDVIYASRYTLVDYSHRVLAVLRFLCVSFAVLSIKPLHLLGDKHSAETFIFVFSLFCESLIQIGLNLELYWYGDGDRKAIQNQTKRETFSHILPATLTYLAAAVIAAWSYSQDEAKDYGEDAAYGNDYGYKNSTDSDYYNSTSVTLKSDDNYNRALAGSSYSSNASYDDEPMGVQWSIADLPLVLCLGVYIFNLLLALYQKSIGNKKFQDIREHFVPNNIDYMIHRYGEWIMLMIGESILSLLIVETTEAKQYYTITGLGCLTVIILQMLKFESQPHHADEHALWRSMTAATLFSILIQVLSMALIAFGVSYKIMLKTVLKEQDSYDSGYGRRLAESPYVTEEANAWLYFVSLSIVLVSLELMMVTHRGVADTFQLLFRINEDTPHKFSPNWPVILITLIKAVIISVTATCGLWERDNYHIAVTGFVIVTMMAIIRIVGWGFIHHRDYINNAMSSTIRSVHRFVKFASESLHEEVDSTDNSDTSVSNTERDNQNDEQPTNPVKHQPQESLVGDVNQITTVDALVAKGTSFTPTEQPRRQRQKQVSKLPWSADQPAVAHSKNEQIAWAGVYKDPESGEPYYVDSHGNATWEKPTSVIIGEGKGITNERVNPTDNKLPAEWKASTDPQSGESYYYHRETTRTTWTKPTTMGTSTASIPTQLYI